MFTIEQAAEKLQMHPATVRRFVREGQIAGIRLGPRQWSISAETLREFMAQGGHANEKWIARPTLTEENE